MDSGISLNGDTISSPDSDNSSQHHIQNQTVCISNEQSEAIAIQHEQIVWILFGVGRLENEAIFFQTPPIIAED